MEYDFIIVGAGLAGCVLAERIATQCNKKVLILEKRAHIGGNCYDEVDQNGILVHRYGPHLFHTDNQKVFDYLSQFTKWQTYEHKVLAQVDDKKIPIPFNLNTLYEVFDQKIAAKIEEKLLQHYGKDKKIPILELLEERDQELKVLGHYIYDKIFVNYTAKQWGKKPEEIEPMVTARVPVITSYDNRYFTDQYQVVPENGYTKLFENMIDHQNIDIRLNTEASKQIEIINDDIYFEDKQFNGKLIYTGMIDELFKNRFGVLPYRSLDLVFETVDEPLYQEAAVINYPNDYKYTRITEFKHIHPTDTPNTTILKEYPVPYDRNYNIPYYPIFTSSNQSIYDNYAEFAKKILNLILVGRLAEYKYYDMDDIVEQALNIFDIEVH